jgi:hypothetical protein
VNILGPSTIAQQERLKADLKKKRTLRSIDSGTVYDVAGKVQWLQRQIAKGEEGDLTDVVICTRDRDGRMGLFHFGSGDKARAHYMLSSAKNRMEPA